MSKETLIIAIINKEYFKISNLNSYHNWILDAAHCQNERISLD